MIRYYLKDKLTLWLNDETVLTFNNSVAIWRIIWGKWDKPDRIILNYDVFKSNQIIKILGDTPLNLSICHKEVGRLDTLEGQDLVYRFENCQINRRWIPQPTLLSPSNGEIVQAFVELTCKIIED